jgi:thiol peroxidase
MKVDERKGIVTMKGEPLTLLGPNLSVGDAAPDFRVVDAGFQPVKLSDFKGQPLLISAVPSLDTSVCSLQTKRFNEEAAKLTGVTVLTISQDLPFAQKRFCETEKIGNIRVLSDHVHREFGLHYGVLIKENALLARSIFVIGKDGKLRHVEIVPELTQHPDYDAALRAARGAAKE